MNYIKMKTSELPAKIVRQIINEGERFWYLQKAKFRFFWVDPDMTKNGKLVAAKIRTVTGLWQCVSDLDFVLCVSGQLWANLSETQQIAVMRHELRHCSYAVDGDGSPKTLIGLPVPVEDGKYVQGDLRLKYKLIPHDVELFLDDIKEQQLPGIEDVIVAAGGKQLEFDFETETESVA